MKCSPEALASASVEQKPVLQKEVVSKNTDHFFLRTGYFGYRKQLVTILDQNQISSFSDQSLFVIYSSKNNYEVKHYILLLVCL